eukprot:jgi/Psemu1/302166/fgenesh1_kg.59_\
MPYLEQAVGHGTELAVSALHCTAVHTNLFVYKHCIALHCIVSRNSRLQVVFGASHRIASDRIGSRDPFPGMTAAPIPSIAIVDAIVDAI